MLTVDEAVLFLRDECGIPIAKGTLYNKNVAGTGPKRIYINGRVHYDADELRAWAASQARGSTRRGRKPQPKRPMPPLLAAAISQALQ